MTLKAAHIIVTGFRIICSPDLTPLDFSVFSVIRALGPSKFGKLPPVYKRQMDNLNELIDEVTNCSHNINEQMLQNIFLNKKVRVRRCLKQDGGHFEPFL
jgi:hypothetical protein